ncbi:MAG TPA: DUF1330 domain-containing protein [Bauldia sp.]|nr:DUF1330 domain-containing protein [Bauldia sp.]
MAKGYWIVGLKINKPEQYAAYREVNSAAFRKFGGRFLARGGKFENPLGEAWPVNTIIEFPSFEAATACFASPEYKAALAVRGDAIETDLVIIEGYDGAQP